MHALIAAAIEWGFSKEVAEKAFQQLLCHTHSDPQHISLQGQQDLFLELCVAQVSSGEDEVTGGGDNLGGSLLLNIDDLREESQEGGDGSDEDEEGDEWEGEEGESEEEGGEDDAGSEGGSEGEAAPPPHKPRAPISLASAGLRQPHSATANTNTTSAPTRHQSQQPAHAPALRQGTLDRHFHPTQPQPGAHPPEARTTHATTYTGHHPGSFNQGMHSAQGHHDNQGRPSGVLASHSGPPWLRTPTPQEVQAVTTGGAAGVLDFVNLRVFGNKSFRETQQDVVHAAVCGKHCFVLMPTGGGKSLCYQLPAVIARGVTIVVCPLLSLMQDQVIGLCQGRPGGCGIPATYLSSQQSKGEALAVLRELNKDVPTCKLLYVTPEQLVKSSVLREVLLRLKSRGRLARVVVDEAHCISHWGHDFRVDYKLLGTVLKAKFPDVPITAVTATATEHVAEDILSTLGISRTAQRFKVSFFRPNLHFAVIDKVYGEDEGGNPEPLTSLIRYIHEQNVKAGYQPQQQQQQRPGQGRRAQGAPPSGIVYCLSRDESEQVARALEDFGGITATHYHAGMGDKARMKVQNDWRAGKVQVVVATIAFGMGIDKPDVRFVAHYTMSKSLEGYFQEAGRAGRDGLPSECVLFYGRRDGGRILNLLRLSRGDYEKGRQLMEMMRAYCEDLKRCRHDILLEYFADGTRSQRLPGGCCGGACDNCKERAQQGTGGRSLARGAIRDPAGQRKRARKQKAQPDQFWQNEEDAYAYADDGEEDDRETGRSGQSVGESDTKPKEDTIAKHGGFMKASTAMATGVVPADSGKPGRGKGKGNKGGSGKIAGAKGAAGKAGKGGAGPGPSSQQQGTLFQAFQGRGKTLGGGSQGGAAAAASGGASIWSTGTNTGFVKAGSLGGPGPSSAASGGARGGPAAGFTSAGGGAGGGFKPPLPAASAAVAALARSTGTVAGRGAGGLGGAPSTSVLSSRAAKLQKVGADKAQKERAKAVQVLAQVQKQAHAPGGSDDDDW